MRWAPGNRIVTGGVVAMPDSGSDRAVRWFLRRLTTMVPALRDVELEPEFVWHGTAGIAPDLMPMIMEPAPNMLAVVSCNGRGIAMTTGMGREIARFLTSNAQDPSSLPVPMTAPRPLPFPWFARAVKSVILPLARRADYAEGAPI
jgi:glycine/D-amino acid oxidase-like deaminating enzyme